MSVVTQQSGKAANDAGKDAVQQAPDGPIGGPEGSLQRGASLNVPPPVARTGGGLKGNWGLFWGAVLRDHCHAGLIWNEGTRAELREALEVSWPSALLACQVSYLPFPSSCQHSSKSGSCLGHVRVLEHIALGLGGWGGPNP